MKTLIAVDAIIATKPVRWLLLISVAMLIVLSLYNVATKKMLALQLAAAKGDKAQYAAQLLTQNTAIIKQGQEYQEQLKRSHSATEAANRIISALERRDPIVFTGDCPDMVQQAIDEVKK